MPIYNLKIKFLYFSVWKSLTNDQISNGTKKQKYWFYSMKQLYQVVVCDFFLNCIFFGNLEHYIWCSTKQEQGKREDFVTRFISCLKSRITSRVVKNWSRHHSISMVALFTNLHSSISIWGFTQWGQIFKIIQVWNLWKL